MSKSCRKRKSKGGQEDAAYIETDRDGNHDAVEIEQRIILCETIADELGTNEADEIDVETTIDNRKDGLLDAIPVEVHIDPCWRNLHLGRDPDTKDADVDEPNNDGCRPLQCADSSLISNKKRDPVDYDLDNLYARQAC